MGPLEIRKIRKSWGMTQVELASELGVARETVSRWENGKETPLRSLERALRRIKHAGKA